MIANRLTNANVIITRANRGPASAIAVPMVRTIFIVRAIPLIVAIQTLTRVTSVLITVTVIITRVTLAIVRSRETLFAGRILHTEILCRI